MDKPDYNIVSFSGGKDSTTMLLGMIERGMPVDCVLFCDTGIEFPEMYEHIQKVESNTGIKITRLKAEHDFEYYMFDYPIKRGINAIKNNISPDTTGWSWAGPRQRWCTSRLKDRPREKFLRPLRENYNVIEYVGIAADEQHRLERKQNRAANHVHPLVEWGMTEIDCLNYCTERGYDWGGLYEHFDRVSCWCCPLQSLGDLRELYKHYPKLWEQLKEWDSRTWRQFRADYGVEQLEQRFVLEDEYLKNGSSVKNKAFFCALKQRLNDYEKTKEV